MNLLCTVCSGVLEPTDYEGTPVMQCSQCRGHLLSRQGVDEIKESGDKSTAELAAEQDRERVGDTLDSVRCPKCGGGMGKEYLTEPDAFHVDYCDACGVLWFDGGELARLQLTYEARRRSREKGRAGGWRSAPANASRTGRSETESAHPADHDESSADHEEETSHPHGEEEEGILASFQNFIGGLFGRGGRQYRRRKWINGEE